MRKLPFVLLAVSVAASAGPWDASFKRIGQMVSTSPTSANLQVPAASYLKVQCDAAAYVGQGQGSGTSCTATSCQKVAAGDVFYVRLLATEDYVAALAVSGTATCQVFRAVGQ